MPSRTYVDVFEMAVDQFGFVTTAQAREGGVNPQALLMMERRGAVRRVSHGVYRLTHFPETELDSYMEAVLWPRGITAVVSHESALQLYELSDVNPARVHITVPQRYRTNRAAPPHLAVHRQDLDADEMTVHRGLPITTPARAILDCHLTALGAALVKQAIDDAVAKGFLTPARGQALRECTGG